MVPPNSREEIEVFAQLFGMSDSSTVAEHDGRYWFNEANVRNIKQRLKPVLVIRDLDRAGIAILLQGNPKQSDGRHRRGW